MAYPFTEDHDMIREAARGFLQSWYDGGKGPEKIYSCGEEIDRDAWQSFAAEQGMAGIAIDEKYGGAGLGDLGRVVVMEELGASLCAVPFFTTCGISADMIAAFGSDSMKSEWLPKIAAGELILAYCDGHDSKTGKVSMVQGAAFADAILLTRRAGKNFELIAIKKDAKDLKITPHETMDPTRGFADVDFGGVTDVEVLGSGTQAAHQDIIHRSFIALAAECVGGAQACLDMTLGYTGQRVQFGRTIASFQAIKHRCADMFILIEAARSAVYYAATASEDEKTQAALMAKAYATDAFYKVACDAIQLHGGIGFTWEYPLHFYFKRARANRAMFGNSSQAYAQLADHILGEVA